MIKKLASTTKDGETYLLLELNGHMREKHVIGGKVRINREWVNIDSIPEELGYCGV